MKHLLLALFCIIPLSLYSAQTAYVKSLKAVVYSDKGLKSPIGYIRQGRKLQVGEVARSRGAVLPVIVAGKIAYIKVEDLALKDVIVDSDLKGHGYTEHVNLEREEEKDDLMENNFLVFGYHQFSGGSEWEEMVSALGDTPSTISHYTIMAEHRPLIYDFFFGIGGGYYYGKTEKFTISAPSADFLLGYNLNKPFQHLYFDFTLGASFSSGVKVDVATSDNIHEGNLYGYSLGIQARIFPQEHYGLVIGYMYRIVNLTNLNDITLSGFQSDYNLRSLSGSNLYIGFHNKF
ncbi:MAG: hypothetical protein OEY33_01805 [Bdellovibrionales bacterium]|nr:hypothetical protein [Bdellovibrionales bacterium]